MITSVKLTHLTPHNYYFQFLKLKLFSVVRTLKIYSLSQFQVHNTMLLYNHYSGEGRGMGEMLVKGYKLSIIK